MHEPIKQCCTFTVNGFLFGVDVLQVREVVESQYYTTVPLASSKTHGLLNLRGEIVTSIDLRDRFSAGDAEPSGDYMNVVVITEEDPISLVVDEMGEVIDIDPELIEPTPDTVQMSVKNLIKGVYKLDTRLMLILDVEAAVAIEEVAS